MSMSSLHKKMFASKPFLFVFQVHVSLSVFLFQQNDDNRHSTGSNANTDGERVDEAKHLHLKQVEKLRHLEKQPI